VAFEPQPAAELVRRAGFTRFEQVACDDIWRRYLSDEPHENASAVFMGVAFV
jgi:hypothetical protein